ncbi:putative holin-like toxin [Paenibacillus larvae]|nr:putative holin-like toxin [Paenibacillus larvae]
MEVKDALTLMISFASLVVLILSQKRSRPPLTLRLKEVYLRPND